MKRLLLVLAALVIFNIAHSGECYDRLEGSEENKLDSSGKIKLMEFEISKFGQQAVIASEYLSSANLQATLYLKINKKYCFAGDLGAFTGYKLDKFDTQKGYYSLLIFSKSGPSKFTRRYIYSSGKYVLSQCFAVTEGRKEKCSEGDE